MERVCSRLDAIGRALDLLTPRLRQLATCDFVVAADPNWIGLHGTREHRFRDGRVFRYRDLAHCCCPESQTRPGYDQRTTVVLPSRTVTVGVVLHELGHVIDERIGFDHHRPDPVSAYAAANDYEAFAEAFELWANPHGPWRWDNEFDLDVLAADHQTLALFAELAR